MKRGKDDYKKKIENHFKENNMKSVWDGMNTMSRRKKKREDDKVPMNIDYANELNAFYARFDCIDFSCEREERMKVLNEQRKDECESERIILTENEVLRSLKKLKHTKSSGPDNIGTNLLKRCADQLCEILCFIFNLSLFNCQVPVHWKTSCIVPVPKKANISTMNDLRPIALTSCIMKVFERCCMSRIEPLVSKHLDPLQFAYRVNRGVDDAILHVVNNTVTHLENLNSCVRLMFFDFSSAFNTIQPHLLCDKLMTHNLLPSTVYYNLALF